MSERSEAKARGDRLYWTGRPCPKGHVADRYASTGTCVECLKADVKSKVAAGYFRDHYAANADRIGEKQRAYAKANREVVSARSAAWSAKNPDKRKAISRQYKARRRAQEEQGITGGMLAAWTLAQPKVCFYCGSDCAGDFHVDHFVPLAKGGAHVLTNLRIACAPCNLRKSARDPLDWMEAA